MRLMVNEIRPVIIANAFIYTLIEFIYLKIIIQVFINILSNNTDYFGLYNMYTKRFVDLLYVKDETVYLY